MSQFVLLPLIVVAVLLALDYYIFRNWRRFARGRRRLHWTLPLYRVLLVSMPLTLPLYFYLSRWWEVEPKLLRALFLGIWAVYYIPKIVVVVALLMKDLARFVTWLFQWYQGRLLTPRETAAPENEPSLDLSDMPHMTRAEFLRKAGWAAATIPFVVVGYGVFRDLYDYRVHHVDIPIRTLPSALDGLRIAQLSDIHAGSFFSPRPMHAAASLVSELKPDLVVITGDFVNHDAREMEVVAPALRTLRADLGVFGCLGNHDHYARVDQVVGRVRAASVHLLVNEHHTLDLDGARLHLIGTDNTGFNQRFADLPAAVSGIERSSNGEDIRILMAHDPTFWDAQVRPGYEEIDLMLSGHTHGGQIGLEFGPLRWSLARVAYHRWAGLYREPRAHGSGDQFLYVNRGLGTVGPPLRLGIRPEVTLLTLKRA